MSRNFSFHGGGGGRWGEGGFEGGGAHGPKPSSYYPDYFSREGRSGQTGSSLTLRKSQICRLASREMRTN